MNLSILNKTIRHNAQKFTIISTKTMKKVLRRDANTAHWL